MKRYMIAPLVAILSVCCAAMAMEDKVSQAATERREQFLKQRAKIAEQAGVKEDQVVGYQWSGRTQDPIAAFMIDAAKDKDVSFAHNVVGRKTPYLLSALGIFASLSMYTSNPYPYKSFDYAQYGFCSVLIGVLSLGIALEERFFCKKSAAETLRKSREKLHSKCLISVPPQTQYWNECGVSRNSSKAGADEDLYSLSAQ